MVGCLVDLEGQDSGEVRLGVDSSSSSSLWLIFRDRDPFSLEGFINY